MDKLTELRNEIDSIDKSIAELLEKRFMAAEKIGNFKKEKGAEITDTMREIAVLSNVSSDVPDQHKECVISVFRAIIEESKKLQK